MLSDSLYLCSLTQIYILRAVTSTIVSCHNSDWYIFKHFKTHNQFKYLHMVQSEITLFFTWHILWIIYKEENHIFLLCGEFCHHTIGLFNPWYNYSALCLLRFVQSCIFSNICLNVINLNHFFVNTHLLFTVSRHVS